MHPRLTPFSGRIAHESLRGTLEAEGYTTGEIYRIGASLTDLDRKIGGPRDRQLIWGDAVLLIDRQEGHAFVQSQKDGYCGWITETALAADFTPTHRIRTRSSHLYPEAKVSAREIGLLPFGAQVEVIGEQGDFAQTPQGFIPKAHLRLLDAHDIDPVAVAEIFLGTPYLWGGNSAAGIDCSGLAQAAMLATGRPCPGDSDMQSAAGIEVVPDQLRAGDLVFWKGHVALVSGEDEIIHATGAFMNTVREPLSRAKARILDAGSGDIIACRRID